MQHKRIIIALLISTAILFVWGYFVPPPQPPQPTPSPSPSAESTVQSMASPTQSPATPLASPAATPAPVVNAAPRRNFVVRTPLFDAKFDSQGAEAISWIIKRNKDTGDPIYSVGGTKQSPMALELISAEGLKRQPRQAPLQLRTGDAAIDQLLMSSTYSIEGVEGSGDAEISVGPNESRRITFRFNDPAMGLDVAKTIVFDGSSYDADLEIAISRGGQAVPAKLRVGPGIGDQGIKHYT
ncbi:MAG: membrane protein insertase YidC, partial [Acidobacteria bacterium]|nr:membrane protein insertase YidC [Acidobacteriota bacterium]